MTDTKTQISEVVSKIRVILNEIYLTEKSTLDMYMFCIDSSNLETKLERVEEIKCTVNRLVKDGDLDSLKDILSKIEEVPDNIESVYKRVIELIDEIYENNQSILPCYLAIETFELEVDPMVLMSFSNLSGVSEVLKPRLLDLTKQRLKEDDYVYLRNVKVRLEMLLGHRERMLMKGFEGYIIKKEDISIDDLKDDVMKAIENLFNSQRDPMMTLVLNFGTSLNLVIKTNEVDDTEYTITELYRMALETKVAESTDKKFLMDILKKLEV